MVNLCYMVLTVELSCVRLQISRRERTKERTIVNELTLATEETCDSST